MDSRFRGNDEGGEERSILLLPIRLVAPPAQLRRAIGLRRVHVAAQLLHLRAHVGRRLGLEAQRGSGVKVGGEGVDLEVRQRQALGLRGEGDAEGQVVAARLRVHVLHPFGVQAGDARGEAVERVGVGVRPPRFLIGRLRLGCLALLLPLRAPLALEALQAGLGGAVERVEAVGGEAVGRAVPQEEHQ